VKAGSRTLGVAFSDGPETSRMAGAVVRADGTLDGLAFERCAVGGTDATESLLDLFDALGREDVRRVLVAGIAPAWFNLVDLPTLRESLSRAVLAASYEASPGLEPALRDAFDGDALAERLAVYRSLPPRRKVPRGGDDGEAEPLFVRAAGIDDDRAADLVRALVREGFRRPEPVRIAAVAASAHREAVKGAD